MTLVSAPRFHERPRTRRPGAGRPRKRPSSAGGPVDLEIIGAAAKLFAKQGVGATTMAQIAEAVGLEVSSLYYYFRNKNDVLERIVVDVNRVPLAIAEQVRLDHADPIRRLHSFVRQDAVALCNFPFDINEIHRLAGDEPETFERYWADRQALLDHVAEFVADGITAEVFVEVDPMLAAVTILANDEAVQNWYRPPARRPADDAIAVRYRPEQIGRFLADLALRGLLTDPRAIPQDLT